MTKVSVIVPMYKGKDYVGPCVRSLKRQGVDDLEILIVDDCSPDGSYQYAADMFKDDSQVKVLRQEENGGPGQARNRGLAEAEGEYVCFADLDDMYVDGAIGEMLQTAEQKRADVVYTSGILLTLRDTDPDDLSELGEPDLLKLAFESAAKMPEEGHGEILGDLRERCERWLKQDFHWNVWGRLYRRSLIEDHAIRFPAISLGEDYLFSLNVLLHADVYAKITKCLYVYRSNASSVSRENGSARVFLNALDAMFCTPRLVDEITKGLSFFDENPTYAERLSDLQIKSAEEGYAVPQYKQIGREALSANRDVRDAFLSAFGTKGDFVRKTLFNAYDAKAEPKIDPDADLSNIAVRREAKKTFGFKMMYVLP